MVAAAGVGHPDSYQHRQKRRRSADAKSGARRVAQFVSAARASNLGERCEQSREALVGGTADDWRERRGARGNARGTEMVVAHVRSSGDWDVAPFAHPMPNRHPPRRAQHRTTAYGIWQSRVVFSYKGDQTWRR